MNKSHTLEAFNYKLHYQELNDMIVKYKCIVYVKM